MSKKKKKSPESENIEVNESVNNSVEESAVKEESIVESAESDVTVADVSAKAIMPTKGLHIDEEEKEAYLEQLRKSKKRKKIIATVVSVVVVLIVAFVIYKIAFSGNDNDVKFSDEYLTKSEPQTSLGLLGDSDSVCTVGEYSLSYIQTMDAMEIKKGNKLVFRSYPRPAGDETLDGFNYLANHDLISSPVIVGYTKSGIEGGLSLGINQMNHTKTLNKIQNGLQIVYYLTDLECEFCIEFVLTDKGSLEVTVPANGIKEKIPGEDDDPSRMPRLASLTVLPFMCAARQDDSGYFVTPDGSGALTYFDTSRVFSNEEYSKRVYGYDDTFDTFVSPDYNNEDISIPAFGSVQNVRNANGTVDHKMYTAFATVGEASAQIIMGDPGVRSLNFYYIAYKFNLREYYYDTISKSGDSYKFLEEKLNVGDMKETICFDISTEKGVPEDGDISEGSYTYVDVALKTKEFIKEKWGIEKAVDTASNQNLVNLKFLMGSENIQSTSLFGQVKVMTTFSDVRNIYEDLSQNGVNNVRLSLLGWQEDGYYGNVTDKYGIESDFGGKSGLEDLLTWADKNGVTVSADNNLLQLYSAPTFGNTLRNTVVKEPGTNYVMFKIANSAGVYTPGTQFYYMSPLYFDENFLAEDIEEIKELGFKNVDLQQVGNILYTDYNSKNALLRQQGLNYYQKWINEYQKSFNEVSVYYGFDYAVKDADILLDVPIESSNLFLIDEAVPFMQIVYHGMIDYYCEPINRYDHPDVAFLKAIEFGCLLSYEVTQENTEELKYTLYNDLFKSEYALLKDDIVEAYNVASEVLSNVRTASIINHYCVDAGESDVNKHNGNVYCTEYDNGYKVYVNYGDSDYTVSDGVTIASMDYLLVK
ncbi:MAG: hypothetical protein IJZ94_03100 [Clostridia bacterium]|nr:hypothetical protein [Clostridia bacterium]